MKPIGRGAYGIVCAACNLRTNERVAIKKMGDVFGNALDAKRTLREVQILRHLTGHSNIIALKDLFPPPVGPVDYNDVYMVQEVRRGRGGARLAVGRSGPAAKRAPACMASENRGPPQHRAVGFPSPRGPGIGARDRGLRSTACRAGTCRRLLQAA